MRKELPTIPRTDVTQSLVSLALQGAYKKKTILQVSVKTYKIFCRDKCCNLSGLNCLDSALWGGESTSTKTENLHSISGLRRLFEESYGSGGGHLLLGILIRNCLCTVGSCQSLLAYPIRPLEVGCEYVEGQCPAIGLVAPVTSGQDWQC